MTYCGICIQFTFKVTNPFPHLSLAVSVICIPRDESHLWDGCACLHELKWLKTLHWGLAGFFGDILFSWSPDNDSLLKTKEKPKNTLLWVWVGYCSLYFEYGWVKTKHPPIQFPAPHQDETSDEAGNKTFRCWFGAVKVSPKCLARITVV